MVLVRQDIDSVAAPAPACIQHVKAGVDEELADEHLGSFEDDDLFVIIVVDMPEWVNDLGGLFPETPDALSPL